jgi:hypothetical protein
MRMTGLRRSGLNPSRLLLAAVFVCLLMLAGAAPSGSAQEAPDQTVTPSATDSTPQSFDTESASDTTPDSAPATSDAATRANSPASPSSDPAAIPTPATIQYWLVSNQPRMVAWGAWDAGLAKDSGAIPELLALANAWQPGASDQKYDGEYLPARDDRRDAMADVLDALLQMNVQIPANTLRSLAADFPNQTTIFLARMPDQESADARMDFFHDSGWRLARLKYVSAALLALHPPPGFALDLMSGTVVRADVTVMLPGTLAFSQGSAGDCASELEADRSGWPQVANYRLSSTAHGGDVELVGGIDPVYFSRELLPGFEIQTCGADVTLTDERRRRLIAEMLGVKPEEIPWQVDPTQTIEFRSQAQFQKELLAFISKEQEKERRTATALADHSLITPGDVSDALPKFEVIIDDERGENAEALVKSAGLPPNVQYGRVQ